MTKKRSYIREILDSIDEKTISFAGGLPNENLFPIKEFCKAIKTISIKPSTYQYSSSYGIWTLRSEIANFYTNKLDMYTTADEILITSGSQQAFDLILKSIDLEDIYIEEPSYLGALSSFKILNKKIKKFKGIKTSKKKLSKKDLVYLISDYSNPSTVVYSNKFRKKVSDLLKSKESYLIEDGAYTFLNFKNKFKKPISSSYDKSFHLGSFSKILSPGLRVGWIRSKKENIDKLIVAKEALDLHTSTFSQSLINEYLNENDIFKHISKLNEDYKNKMNYMCKCFDKFIPSFKYKKPKGGMFIYGSFDIDSYKLAKLAMDKNISFVPGEVFYLNKKSNEARFNFSNASKKDIKKGIKMLSDIILELK